MGGSLFDLYVRIFSCGKIVKFYEKGYATY